MFHLMTLSKRDQSLQSVSSLDGGHGDVVTSSCFPWRTLKARIPAALCTLQLKVRGKRCVTSQKPTKIYSARDRRSFFGLFGKRRSNRVMPFEGPEDGDLCPLQSVPTESKSVGTLTYHFAKLISRDSGRKLRSSSVGRLNKSSHSLPCVVDVGDGVTDCVLPTPHTAERLLQVSEESTAEERCEEMLVGKADEGPVRTDSRHDENHDVLVFHYSDDATQNFVDPSSPPLSPNLERVEDAFSTEECSWDADVADNSLENKSTILSTDDKANFPDDDLNADQRSRKVSIPYEDVDNVDEEINFFDRTSEESDDYLDIDGLIDRCPKTDVIENLQSAVQLSRCATHQLEKALKKWSRISCGPFPRQPGTGKTKAEIVDDKSSGLRRETARYLDEMNKIFFNFYCVTEELDDVEMRQARLVESMKEEMVQSKEFKLPRRKQDWADLCLNDRQSGRFEHHKFKAMLGKRILPTIDEVEAEENYR